MVQLIEKHGKSYRLVINGRPCTFMPVSLFKGNDLFPLKPQVHRSKGYLFWNVNGKQISYWQIKKALQKSEP